MKYVEKTQAIHMLGQQFTKKDKIMKKLMLIVGILLLGSEVKAQTGPEVLKAYNDGVCENVGLSAACSDAQHLAAYCTNNKIEPCVDTRAADNKVYSTVTTWNAAVNAPQKQLEMFTKRQEIMYARLMTMVRNNRLKCIDIMTAAGLDTFICK